MRSKCIMSGWCAISTILFLIILAGIAVWFVSAQQISRYYTLGYLIFVIVFLLLSLFYCPISIEASESAVIIRRVLWRTVIPYVDIRDVQLYQPTMGEHRLCGSGGFLGHWGWFSERSIGRYFAYYGKSSDCFLLRLKSGRQYMLGCFEPARMAGFIRSQIG